MAFQPFGYRFEVSSPSSPSEVKAVIRSRKKGWLDPKNGARGWIVGPFVCVWFSAFNKNGPMLIGHISRDNFGTRISGRAGSDLNGLGLACLLMPALALLFYQMLADGSYTAEQVALLAGFVGAIWLLVFWAKHAFRREAEPLVRFLRDAVTTSGRAPRAELASNTISKALALTVGGENFAGPVTPNAIHDALLGVGAGDFVILASGAEAYLQTASRDGDGYILEMRDGDARRHFQAMRRSGAPEATGDPDLFTFDEVREAFMAYASEAPIPRFLLWERMHLAE